MGLKACPAFNPYLAFGAPLPPLSSYIWCWKRAPPAFNPYLALRAPPRFQGLYGVESVQWWKKIALYLLTHGEQNHLELQSWREEKVGINPAPHRTESDFNFNLQIPVNCCHFQSDVCSFLLCYVLISLALTRGLRPEKLQLNVCFHFLFVIKDIFNLLLAHKIKTIKYV